MSLPGAILTVRRTVLYNPNHSSLTKSLCLKVRDDFISCTIRRTIEDCRHSSTLQQPRPSTGRCQLRLVEVRSDQVYPISICGFSLVFRVHHFYLPLPLHFEARSRSPSKRSYGDTWRRWMDSTGRWKR